MPYSNVDKSSHIDKGVCQLLLRLFLPCVFATVLGCQMAMASPQGCNAIDTDLATAYNTMYDHSAYAGRFDDRQFILATDQFYDAIGRYSMMSEGIACPLLKAQKAGVRVHTAKDGNFRALSWDEYTGGTMHFYDGIIQYQSPIDADYEEGSRLHTLTHALSANVLGVATIDLPVAPKNRTDNGPNTRRIYLVNGSIRGSTTYHAQFIRLYEVAGHKLLYPNLIQTSTRKTNELGFEYNAFSLYDQNRPANSLFNIDNAQKTITFPVVINTKKYPYGEVTQRNIKYQFVKGYFKKVQ